MWHDCLHDWVQKKIECDTQTHICTHTHTHSLGDLQGECRNYTFTTNLPPSTTCYCKYITQTCHLSKWTSAAWVSQLWMLHKTHFFIEPGKVKWGNTTSPGASVGPYEFSFCLLCSSGSFPSGLAWVGQEGDGQLIKQTGKGLHEKLIRVLMKEKGARPVLHW